MLTLVSFLVHVVSEQRGTTTSPFSQAVNICSKVVLWLVFNYFNYKK